MKAEEEKKKARKIEYIYTGSFSPDHETIIKILAKIEEIIERLNEL